MKKHSKKTKDPSVLVENALLKISVLGLLSVVFIQFFFSNNSMKTIITDTSNKAVSIEESALYNEKGWIELEIKHLNKYKNLAILIDGIEAEGTLQGENIIKLEVYDKEVIEIDATDYEESISIKLHDKSKNIQNLKVGESFTSNKDIVYLFKIKIAEKNNS